MGVVASALYYVRDYGFATPRKTADLLPYLLAFFVRPLGGYLAGLLSWRSEQRPIQRQDRPK